MSCHASEQPEGAGAPESRVHHRGHRNRRRDLLPVHGAPCIDERVPCARAQRAERRPEVTFLLV